MFLKVIGRSLMSNFVITKDSTYDERMDAIRDASKRLAALKKREAYYTRQEVDPKPGQDLDENHNHWTDAPQYAEKYYGEKMRDTVAMDNDWD